MLDVDGAVQPGHRRLDRRPGSAVDLRRRALRAGRRGPGAEQEPDGRLRADRRRAGWRSCRSRSTTTPPRRAGAATRAPAPGSRPRSPTARRRPPAAALERVGVELEPRAQWPTGMDRLGVPGQGQDRRRRGDGAGAGRGPADRPRLGTAAARAAARTDAAVPPGAAARLRRRCCADWGWAQRPVGVVAMPSRTPARSWSTRWPRGIAEMGRMPWLGALDLGDGGPTGEPGGNSAFRLAGVWERLERGPGPGGSAGAGSTARCCSSTTSSARAGPSPSPLPPCARPVRLASCPSRWPSTPEPALPLGSGRVRGASSGTVKHRQEELHQRADQHGIQHRAEARRCRRAASPRPAP